MIIMIVFLHKKTTIINITIKEKAEQMAAKEALVQRAREEAIRRYKIEKAKRVIADHQKKKDVIEKSKKDVSTVASLKKLIFNSEEINDYALTNSNFEKLVISPRIIQDGNKLNILKNYNNVFINQFKLINSPFAENKEFEATSDKLHELLQIKNNANLKLISPFYLYEVSNVETGLSLST
jgi:HD superfamily phosphohydrolase